VLNKNGGSGILTRSKPLWIIVRHQNNRMEVLTDSLKDYRGSFLAVFSFEEEAQTFLGLLKDEEKQKGWSTRETAPGELVSVLMAPCADVLEVALDPLPSSLSFGRTMLPLVSVKREAFVRRLLEEREEWSGELVPA
jgi:hypothetical protein